MRTLKVVLVLFISKLFCVNLVASASGANSVKIQINGENGWYIPQKDGSLVWMDKTDAEAMLNALQSQQHDESLLGADSIANFALLKSEVKFYLYTKLNSEDPIQITQDSDSIMAANFNAAYPTRFVIHGWGGSYKDAMNTRIRDAWFSRGNYNIIIVDWSRARSLDYATSVIAVPKTGQTIASMIDYLHQNHGMSLNTLVVIGHSLGSQVAGHTGKNVQSGKIHTIIGCDPAFPLYSYDKPDNRLNSTDAFYVETIQTNGGLLGFLKPIGKSSFYPNGGKWQPGCGTDLTGSCSHNRSVTYYIETIEINNFPAMKCDTYEDAVNKECGFTYSLVKMGSFTNAYMVGGNFYVPIQEEAPWGMGRSNK